MDTIVTKTYVRWKSLFKSTEHYSHAKPSPTSKLPVYDTQFQVLSSACIMVISLISPLPYTLTHIHAVPLVPFPDLLHPFIAFPCLKIQKNNQLFTTVACAPHIQRFALSCLAFSTRFTHAAYPVSHIITRKQPINCIPSLSSYQ